MISEELNSIQTLVESPFIIVKIGDYTFGNYTETDFPNYVQSLKIIKVNGAVNEYTLTLIHQITETSDPNLIDKVLSTVATTRKIVFSYGDCLSPEYIYKEESAVITTVTQSLDVAGSSITYTIGAVSDAIKLESSTYNFPATTSKASDEIFSLLSNATYGLSTIFTGMSNIEQVKSSGIIATNDEPVDIPAENNTTIMGRLNTLTNSMKPLGTGASLATSIYSLIINDGIKNLLGGSFFSVKEVSSNTKTDNSTTFSVDIGYPGKNFVTDFQVNDNQGYSILLDESVDIKQSKYVYNIDDTGKLYAEDAPSIMRSKSLQIVTPSNQSWWTKMTQFPITATISFKGLTKPTMLMNSVRLNVYFYGNKHTSSGLYAVTKEEDSVDANGYKTTLTMVRIGEDI